MGQVGALGGEKRVGEHAHGDGVVPRGPGPDLGLIDADEILSLLVVLLDLPSGSRNAEEGGRRGRICGVGEEVGDLEVVVRETPTVALPDVVRSTVDTFGTGSTRSQLIEVTVEPDHSVRARMAFFALGEAGGGLSAEQVTVRLCADLLVSPNLPHPVELADGSCPSWPLPSGGFLESADETIELAG